MVKWAIAGGILLVLVLLAVLVVLFRRKKVKSHRNKGKRDLPSSMSQEQTLTVKESAMQETTPLEDEYTVGVDPAPLEDTLILEDSRTQELPDILVPFVEEAPEGLKDSKTEMLFPESAYADVGYSSLKGTREYQQDALDVRIYEEVPRVIGVLCDGMGGMESGEKASALAVAGMMKKMAAPWEKYPDVMLDAAEDMNDVVRGLKDEATGRRLKAGTTLTAVMMERDEIYLCSVGDSRIYLFRNGTFTQLTKDHVYGVELDRMAADGEITALEALDHPKRGALTSYLGISALDKISYNKSPVKLSASDIVLMCSDGLYRSLSDQEITFILSQSGGNMQLAARRLCATAVSKQGQHDNTSVLLIQYKGMEKGEKNDPDTIP